MPATHIDANGHETRGTAGTVLTAGTNGVTAVGKISPYPAAGASPTVVIANSGDATDRTGFFTLNPVTGGGAQAAGKVARIQFSKPYAEAPRFIGVTILNETDGTAPVVAYPAEVSTDGFAIYVNTALTTAKSYTVRYFVVA
jgi:hypothetical protein